MNLKRWILKHMALSHPHPLTCAILHGGALGSFPRPPTLTEVREALEALEAKGHVLTQRDELDDDEIRYGLTPTGQMAAKR